jgi:hypothetical protein
LMLAFLAISLSIIPTRPSNAAMYRGVLPSCGGGEKGWRRRKGPEMRNESGASTEWGAECGQDTFDRASIGKAEGQGRQSRCGRKAGDRDCGSIMSGVSQGTKCLMCTGEVNGRWQLPLLLCGVLPEHRVPGLDVCALFEQALQRSRLVADNCNVHGSGPLRQPMGR